MRSAIKYGGTIYVAAANLENELVERVRADHGAYRERGNVIPGGWWNLLEPVNEAVLDTLRADGYRIEIVE